MRVRFEMDARPMLRKLGIWKQNRRPSRQEAAKIAGRAVMMLVIHRAPRDTNRYVRGWAIAGNDAGLGPLPVPAVEQSSQMHQRLRQLEKQMRFWTRRKRALEAAGRTHYKGTRKVNGSYRRGVTKDYRKAVREEQKAAAQLQKYQSTRGTGIVIGGRKRKDGTSMATVRDKVYGGTGRMIDTAAETAFELRNLEPHARLVERKTRNFSRALTEMRKTAGIRSVGRKYIEEIDKGAGLRPQRRAG